MGKFILIFSLFSIFYKPVWSQDVPMVLNAEIRNQRFSEVLDSLSKTYDIRCAYDAVHFDTLFVDAVAREVLLDEFLERIAASEGMCVKLIADTYTFFNCKEDNKLNDHFFKGVLQDAATGESLPFGNVLIGKNNGTSSNQLGIFVQKQLLGKFIHMNVSYLGYSELDTIIWFDDPAVFHEIKLKRVNTLLNPVAVEGKFVEMVEQGDEIGTTVFNPMMGKYLPHFGEPDALHALALLPGVCSMGSAGGFSIRGSLPYSNLILLDGLPVYKLDHYLGNVSTVNPKYIKTIKLSKGGFGAEYGGSIAGVVDITGRTGNRVKPVLDVSLNLLSVNALAEIPIGEKLTLLMAGRRSYTELIQTYLFKELFKVSRNQKNSTIGLEEITPNLNLSDYHLKLTHQQSEKESFSVSAYSSTDKLDFNLGEQSEFFNFSIENDERWMNRGLGGEWKKQISANHFTTLNVNLSTFDKHSYWQERYRMYGSEIDELFDENYLVRQNNEVESIQLKSENNLLLSNQISLNLGFKLRKNKIRSFYEDSGDPENDYSYDFQEEGTTYSFFTSLSLKPQKKIWLVPGIRSTYFSLRKQLYWEPRLAVSYQISPELSLHYETGTYYQFINNTSQFDELGNVTNFWTLGEDGAKVPKSFHVQGGLSFADNGWLVNFDIYMRRSKGISATYFQPVYVDGEVLTFENKYFGLQKSSGVDLLVKKRFRRLMSTASFAYGRTYNKFEDINLDEYFPAINDRPLQVDLSSIYSIAEWHFSYKWSYASGKPISDLENVLEYNSERLSGIHSLDLAVMRKFKINKLKGDFGISLINVYNKRSVLQRRFLEGTEFSDSELDYETTIVSNGFMPVFFINLRF